MKKYQYQIGIGLLELMLILAIIAALLLGGIRYYQKMRASVSSNKLAKAVISIAANKRY